MKKFALIMMLAGSLGIMSCKSNKSGEGEAADTTPTDTAAAVVDTATVPMDTVPAVTDSIPK
ncbi:hypothetical protein ACLI1A_07910 [Flavobacterium sp. RHBU_3]|uniref:hypothetical protein n=1 Tax=Flavobacterium sp. RHBU_3 TaxID=3391184 RepID=UPI003984A354